MHRVGTVVAGLSALIACGLLSAASGETAKAKRNAAADPACDRASFRLALDVGHSATVPGAVSARGAGEYEFNLRQSQEIFKALKDAGFAKTTLLVSDDPPRSGLFKRVERAHSLSADLFLSIHHDSVPNQFLQKWEVDGRERGYSDRFKGHSIFISNDNGDPRGSLLFGQLLGNAMKSRGLQYTPHYVEPFMGNRRRVLVDAEAGVYRYDQLIVLRQTQMPAVLLEAGSIINRHEEMDLHSPERRGLITQSVVDAVAAFCALRSESTRTGSTARVNTRSTPSAKGSAKPAPGANSSKQRNARPREP